MFHAKNREEMPMQSDNTENRCSNHPPRNNMKELGALALGLLRKIGGIAIILVLVVLSYPVLELVIEYCRAQSEAYHAATQFAVTNSDVTRVTGPVSTVRIDNRFNFHFCGKQADYTLELTGENADATLQIQVKYLEGSWGVTEAVLYTADHTTRVLRQTTTDWSVDSSKAGFNPFLWKNACYATSFPPMVSGTF